MDRLTDELPRQPEEGLFKVVVGLGRNVVVLQVLLSVEHDRLGLHLAVLDVDLVAAQDDGDVFADADQVAVPVGHVLVRHPRGHVEHDDGALALRGERKRNVAVTSR